MKLSAPFRFQVDLKPFISVNHTVDAGPVRALLPRTLELQVFHENSIEKAWVTTAAFFNQNFHWNLMPFLGFSFWQLTFRTYVRFKGRNALYFFATDIGCQMVAQLQGLFAVEASNAEIETETKADKRGRPVNSWTIRSQSANGRTELRLKSVKPNENVSPRESLFLTHRLHGLVRSPWGLLMDQTVQHAVMNPQRLDLVSGRCELWRKLQILTDEEFMKPHSVYIQPEIKFSFFPPFPAAFASAQFQWPWRKPLEFLRD